MSSDVLVSFGGETKSLRDQLRAAQLSVDENLGKMKDSADAANPAFVRLQEAIDKLNESAGRTAGSTRTLETYANIAFLMNVATSAAHTLTGTLKYSYEGVKLLGSGVVIAASGVVSLTSSVLEYSRSQAYLAQYLPVVRVENEGLIASIGRASEAWNNYWRSVNIAKSGLVEITGATIAASGGMRRFEQAAQSSGMGSATEAIRRYTDQLTRVPGMTNEVAGSIVASFGSIPSLSAPMIESLVGIVTQMSATKEQAQALSEQLTKAMSDPATSGEAFLVSQRDISAELLRQFDTAKRNMDVGGMQSVIIQEMIAKEKTALDEKTRVLRENLKALEAMGPLGRMLEGSWRSQVKEANQALEALRQQSQVLEDSAAKLRQMPQSMNQMELAARGIVASMSPFSHQLDEINGKLNIMRNVYGAIGGASMGSTPSAKELIRQFEGYRERAYPDYNSRGEMTGYAVGYGTHQMTDGSAVRSDSRMSREEAEANLDKRVEEFATGAAARIGEAWKGLSDNAKASLTSLSYNYGVNRIPDSVIRAAGTGSEKLLADAIRDLGRSDPLNANRRNLEAANITNQQPGGNLASGSLPMTKEAADAMGKLADNAQAAQDAMRGGNAVAQAQADILRRTEAGQKDSVKDAQQLVDAWRQDLANANTMTSRMQAQNGLRSAEISLAEKMREVDRSRITLAAEDDTTAKEKLATAKKLHEIEMRAAGDDVAARNAALTKMKAAESAYESEMDRSKKESENLKYEIESAGLDRRRAKLQEDLATHRITASQKLSMDLALESERTALEIRHYTSLRDLEEKDTIAYQQAQNKLTLITAESAARRQQIISQDTRKIQQDYDRAFQSIGSSLTSSIMGMIQGTSNFRQLLGSVATSIIQIFVKMGVDSVMVWGAAQARMIAQTIAGQSSQTAAVAAGSAAKLATQTSTAAAGAAVEKASTLTTISADAGKAGAGAYSAIAGIPIIGPILAPAAAAVAYGATMAFGSFDTGSWSIPHDQLAMVHAGEMIVPSRGGIAEEFRSMMSGDSGRPSSTTINVGFVDTAGAKHFIKKHGDRLARAVSSHMTADPSSRPTF